MLLPDTILQNRYRLLRELGRGGMGNVYEALDQRLKCRVALKQMYAAHNADARRAFEREAALLANLRHAALPKVIDYFSESDSDFLVMEFISGSDLAELLARDNGPFPESQVIDWALNTLRVLEYLHAQEPPIVHRDIKPANLKLTTTGELFLLDFGIAKGSLGAMSSLATSRSVRAFTPVYASLEQVLGLGTDARSDIYSLGATLYHLLAGAAPIDAPTRFQLIEDEQRDPLQSVETINPAISQSVGTVIYAAMAVSRKNRFSSAAAMRSALLSAAEQGQRKTENQRERVDKAQISQALLVPTVKAPPPEARSEAAMPEIRTLHAPQPELMSFVFPPAKIEEPDMSVDEDDDEYRWFCSKCRDIIKEADEYCPNCGSDTTNVVEESDEGPGRFRALTKKLDVDHLVESVPQLGYFFRGQSKYARRDFDGAIADFSKSIEIDPNQANHASSYLHRGLALNSKREHDAAIADYNRAIQIAPDYADAYINRSLARSSKRDLNSAIADCDKAIALEPQNARAYAVRGMARYDQGDLKKAIIDCDKALEINPTLASAYASRGAAKLRLGEDQEAQQDFAEARKLDEDMGAGLEQMDQGHQTWPQIGLG
ncbi:MAG TPA: protein kinase [Pyrinomonadaceae bacterium]|nr:protein kinase [Pyrinomonadaceae bacterium]